MSEKKIAQYMRLKDNHPVIIKLNKLAAYADKLGISITFDHNGSIVEDKDWKGPMLRMDDLEDSFNSGVMEWPPSVEFKVTYTNPAYAAEQKRIHDEWVKKQEELAQQKSEAAKKAAATRLENERKIKEAKDRQELARLKEMYPNG